MVALPPLCVRACVCMYTFLCHCVNFHTHSIHNTTLQMENAREETQQQQEQQKSRKNGNTGNNKRSSTALSPSFSLSRTHSLCCPATCCRVACMFVRVFVFWLQFLVLFLPPPPFLFCHFYCCCLFRAFACACLFLPLIAAPQSRQQIL